jgi:hypothetical protein
MVGGPVSENPKVYHSLKGKKINSLSFTLPPKIDTHNINIDYTQKMYDTFWHFGRPII